MSEEATIRLSNPLQMRSDKAVSYMFHTRVLGKTYAASNIFTIVRWFKTDQCIVCVENGRSADVLVYIQVEYESTEDASIVQVEFVHESTVSTINTCLPLSVKQLLSPRTRCIRMYTPTKRSKVATPIKLYVIVQGSRQ